MGKKGVLCCIPLKKAPSRTSREKKDKKTRESSKGQVRMESPNTSQGKTAVVSPSPEEEVVVDTEAVARASAVAAEAAAAAAHAAAEVVRLTTAARPPSTTKSKEEVSAIKIQTAFRGHKARKATRALKALVRLRILIQGRAAKHQAATTLQAMQTMGRVQAHIRERRLRVTEENQALHRHLHNKHEKELAELAKNRASAGDEWDGTKQSKQEIQAKVQNKQVAAARREKALAYSFTHQQTWRGAPRPGSHETIMDPNNPHWGWSWLERWMASRPWESHAATPSEKDLPIQPDSAKSTTTTAAAAHSPSPHALSTANKTSTPVKKPKLPPPSAPTRTKTPPISASTRKVSRQSSAGGDARSTRSTASSSLRDDDDEHDTAVSSPTGPAPRRTSTGSVKVKSRLSKSTTPEREPVGTAKKRLSLPAPSTDHRRHSGPPKIIETAITSQGSN